MYKRLVAYKQFYQTAIVPRHYIDDPSFSIWVSKQRFKHNKRKKYINRIELLNQIDFVWSAKKYHNIIFFH